MEISRQVLADGKALWGDFALPFLAAAAYKLATEVEHEADRLSRRAGVAGGGLRTGNLRARPPVQRPRRPEFSEGRIRPRPRRFPGRPGPPTQPLRPTLQPRPMLRSSRPAPASRAMLSSLPATTAQ